MSYDFEKNTFDGVQTLGRSSRRHSDFVLLRSSAHGSDGESFVSLSSSPLQHQQHSGKQNANDIVMSFTPPSSHELPSSNNTQALNTNTAASKASDFTTSSTTSGPANGPASGPANGLANGQMTDRAQMLDPVPRGSWTHPFLDVIAAKQPRSPADYIKRFVLNTIVLFALHTVSESIVSSDLVTSALDAIPLLQVVLDYLQYPLRMIKYLLLYNILESLWRLRKGSEPFNDLPLTPQQRSLIGLPYSPKAATPGQEITPPKYRTSSPISQISYSTSPIRSRSFSGSSRRSIQQQLSPRNQLHHDPNTNSSDLLSTKRKSFASSAAPLHSFLRSSSHSISSG